MSTSLKLPMSILTSFKLPARSVMRLAMPNRSPSHGQPTKNKEFS